MVIIQGVHPGFEMMEMIADFFVFEIFDSGIFLGRKGFFRVFKTIWSFMIVAVYSWLRSCINIVQPNLFCSCFSI